MSTNLFASESLLIARLREALPSAVQALTAPYLEDLDDLETRARRMPAVFVMNQGAIALDAPEGSAPARRLRLRERWALIVGTQDKRDLLSGAGARAAGGELADIVIGAVHGWRPSERGRAFVFERAMPPFFLEHGTQLLPLLFTLDIARVSAGD